MKLRNLQTPAAPSIRERWAVTVDRNGETVVTIASDFLSGRDLLPGDEDTIRDAARHLLAFLGDPDPVGPRPEEEKGDARLSRALQNWFCLLPQSKSGRYKLVNWGDCEEFLTRLSRPHGPSPRPEEEKE